MYYYIAGETLLITIIFIDMDYLKYIQNEQHYNEVLALSAKVKHTLWIGTADIKDVYVKKGSSARPFLGVLSELVRRKVKIRLLHAKTPGINFQTDFKKYANLRSGLEMSLCPRVHFKIMLFDMETVYIGSANLTGAGIGMKGVHKRNFETGILTNSKVIVQQALEQFDSIWMGQHCKKCGRKQYCKQPISK